MSQIRVRECFEKNTTLESMFFAGPTFLHWCIRRNYVCNKLGASSLQRSSIPENLDKDKIEPFLRELQKSSHPLKKMKLVVLGHGGIGKTTLLAALRNILDPLHPRSVCSKLLSITLTFFQSPHNGLDGRNSKHNRN